MMRPAKYTSLELLSEDVAAGSSAFEIKYICRVHLFLNGSLQQGKALAFSSDIAMPQFLELAARKFNLMGEDKKKSTAGSSIQEYRAARNLTPKIRIFTIKGSEIEDVREIIHDDVLFVVREGEDFLSPLPLEQILTFQIPQTRTRLTAVAKRAPWQNFFDKFVPELYHTVFSFFDHRMLVRIMVVCREWNKYANEENLWKELCANVNYWREKRRRERRALEDQQFALRTTNAASTSALPAPAGSNASPTVSSAPMYRYSTSTSASGKDEKLPKAAASSTQEEASLKSLLQRYHDRKQPPTYKSWKTFFRYYILWAGALTWDTTERGTNIKFKNNNMTIFRDDAITYHWQTVRGSLPIYIPSETQKKQNGVYDGNPDDIAIYEWEIYIDTFDKSNNNGWWVVFGLETEQFPYKESTPTNLIGYDRNLGWGYACGNGDSLHCYSNPTLKNRQLYTCDPIKPWCNTPYKQGDTIRARLKYYTKVAYDTIDPKEYIGATLEFFLNGKCLGQAFRNITANVVYPAVSLLPNQMVTLRNVDPIMEHITDEC